MQFDVVANLQVPLGAVVLAFLLFELKQLLADFVLQTGWMAHGKQRARNWLAPLAVHCLIHATGTLAIALALNPQLWWLAILDFGLHGAIDYGKARIGLAAGLSPEVASYWWLFGVDQQMHALTHMGLAIALIAG